MLCEKLFLFKDKKMNAEDLSKIPFKDFDATSLDITKNILLTAIFAGLTAAKIDKVAEYSGNAENLSALKRFATPGTAENDSLNTNLSLGAPEWPALKPVMDAIHKNPAFVV